MKRRNFIRNGLLFVPIVPNIIVRGASLVPFNPQSRTVAAGGGGFTPPAGNTLWLDATDVDDPVDGQPVATWSDTSGSANHATQGTAANKPTYKTGIVNGLPVVRFDGTADYVQSTCTDYGTVFGVLNMTTLAANKSWVGAQSSSSGSWDAYLIGTTSDTDTPVFRVGKTPGSSFDGATGTNGSIVDDTFLIWTTKQSGALDLAQYINGGAAGTNSAASTPQGNLQNTTIGAGYFNNAVVDFWPGDVAEVLIFNSALSNADLNSVGDYLGTKYAITWNTIT